MKKRLLIGFIVLLALDLVITIMYFLFSIKPVKIPYLFMVLGSNVFLYWFMNLAAYGFRKIGTLTFLLVFFSFVSIFFFVLLVLGIKESGFDPFCAAILPFPIITISWIIAEYKGEDENSEREKD